MSENALQHLLDAVALTGRKYGLELHAGKFQLITLATLQLAAAVFTGLDTANDFWGGLFTAMGTRALRAQTPAESLCP